MNRPAPLRLLATAVCCLLAACSGSSNAIQRSRDLAGEGNYYLALAALEETLGGPIARELSGLADGGRSDRKSVV